MLGLLLATALASGCAEETPVTDAPGACETFAPRPPGLVVAGSGTGLALARALARRYMELAPGARVLVDESIGTSGAIHAVVDGAIDVGIASRPLSAKELALDLRATPIARVALAILSHSETGATGVTADDLVHIYSGTRDRWPSGERIVPLLRERGDSGSDLLGKLFPTVGAALDDAAARGAWHVAYTDQEMRDGLLLVPGAVGLLDMGTLALEHLPLVPLALEGVAPSRENAANGRYPLVKELLLLTRREPSAAAAELVALARSDVGAELLAGAGYLPPEAP